MLKPIGRSIFFLTNFPGSVWTLMFGTLLTRISLFMVWPFIAIIMAKEYGLGETLIGFFLSLSFLVGASASAISGQISDIFGRKSLLLGSCIINIVAFLILAYSQTLFIFILGSILVGIGKSTIEPPTRAMVSDLIESQSSRDIAHQFRYYLVNVGAALGPIIGIYLGVTGERTTFSFVAASNLIYLLGILLTVSNDKVKPQTKKLFDRSSSMYVEVFQDKKFMNLLLANTLVVFCYMHQESTLVQYLYKLNIDAVSLYSKLIFANALVVILFQIPITFVLKNVRLIYRVYMGVAGFFIGFAFYAVLDGNSPILYWIGATIVLSVGEVLLFPTFNLLIDRSAKSNLRGTYFGVANLITIGMGISPLIGGLFLQFLTGSLLFTLTCILLVLSVFFYWKYDNYIQHEGKELVSDLP